MNRPIPTPYDSGFYDEQSASSSDSAAVVVPIVMQLLGPRSVVDVGCGSGHWLAEFRRAGVEDLVGIDGDYVERSRLRIPADRFQARDLESPFDLGRRFDLAISVEVAEHLDRTAADQFVESLVRAAPVVLFSAAVPGQDGAHHVNCQWPPYWIAKFASHGYGVYDVVRPIVWTNPRVDWVYAQNLFVFADSASADKFELAKVSESASRIVSLVHPRHLDVVLAGNVSRYSVRALAGALPSALARSLSRRLARVVGRPPIDSN